MRLNPRMPLGVGIWRRSSKESGSRTLIGYIRKNPVEGAGGLRGRLHSTPNCTVGWHPETPVFRLSARVVTVVEWQAQRDELGIQ